MQEYGRVQTDDAVIPQTKALTRTSREKNHWRIFMEEVSSSLSFLPLAIVARVSTDQSHSQSDYNRKIRELLLTAKCG